LTGETLSSTGGGGGSLAQSLVHENTK